MLRLSDIATVKTATVLNGEFNNNHLLNINFATHNLEWFVRIFTHTESVFYSVQCANWFAWSRLIGKRLIVFLALLYRFAFNYPRKSNRVINWVVFAVVTVLFIGIHLASLCIKRYLNYQLIEQNVIKFQ